MWNWCVTLLHEGLEYEETASRGNGQRWEFDVVVSVHRVEANEETI
jgi:hypothetical protein